MEIKQTARHVGPEVGLSPDHKIPSSGRLPAYRCLGPRGYLSFTVAVQLCGVAKPLSSCSGFWNLHFFRAQTKKFFSCRSLLSCTIALCLIRPGVLFLPLIAYIIATGETYICIFFSYQERSSLESHWIQHKALFTNELNRNCSKFPFILIEAICLHMKMSLTLWDRKRNEAVLSQLMRFFFYAAAFQKTFNFQKSLVFQSSSE